jgi:hypothetical protein
MDRQQETKRESKIKTLEVKLTSNRIRWYEHILRMNEDRISKNVLNVKLKEKQPRGK